MEVDGMGCFVPFANNPLNLCYVMGPGHMLDICHWGAGNSLSYNN